MPSRRRDHHLDLPALRERTSLRAVPTILALVGLTAVAACGDDRSDGAGDDSTGTPGALENAPENGEPERGESAEPVPSGPPKRIFAKRFVVNIRSEPNHEAARLGYMRAGAVIQAKTAAPAHRDEGCPRGWFELSTGGFVCNGRDVTAFDGERLPEGRAIQPDLEAVLPYEYGRVRSKAPLYRRLPTDEEAAQYEGYVIPGSEPVAAASGDAPSSGDAPADPAAAATADVAAAPAAPQAPAAPAAPAPATGGATLAAVAAPAVPTESAEPPPPTTLGTLMGEDGSVVHRYLVPGFILSLDRVFLAGQRRYYRTQNNGFVPFSRIGPRRGSDFQGVAIAPEGPTLPLAFAVQRSVQGYERTEQGRMRPSRAAALAYHDRVFVVAEENDGHTSWLRTAEGRYYREQDLTVLRAQPRPPEVPEGAQWIDIDLTHQTLVAYEGDRPVYATLISSGRVRRPGDPELDHRTPPGVYQVRAKHVTTTMDGDSAVDGPYSIEDVPYVMYFHGAYALHSAFWHDRFGHTKSHGCVNLAPLDARHIFHWAGPRLELGWHGAFPTESNPAAWVIVRGETPLG